MWCQACMRSFGEADILVVKTIGSRKFFCGKSGKERTKQGQIYLHDVNGCLKKYDRNYTPKKMVVPQVTSSRLDKNIIKHYKLKGMKFL